MSCVSDARDGCFTSVRSSPLSIYRPSPPLPQSSPFPKARIITPSEDDPRSSENAIAKTLPKSPSNENILSTIDQMEKSHSEGPLSFTIPPGKFFKILEALNWPEDQRWPRYSYNAAARKMIITFMPSPVHEAITYTLSNSLATKVFDQYPISTRTQIIARQCVEDTGFSGKYSGSRKTPDLSIELRNSNRTNQVKIVLEVGFTETYAQLVGDARLWIEGHKFAPMVILAKMTEHPKYGNPLLKLDDDAIKRLNLPDPSMVDELAFVLGGPLGPVTMNNFTWCGALSEAFIEIWKPNPTTGRAEKVGDRLDLLNNAVLRLKLGDIIKIDSVHDDVLTVTSEEFCKNLQIDMISLALSRFRCATQPKPVQDQDYEPGLEG